MFRSRKNIIIVLLLLFIISTFLFLTYLFPKSLLGQRHLQAKAYNALVSETAEVNQSLRDLPLKKNVKLEKYCNELIIRELEKNERGWVKECIASYDLEINLLQISDPSATIAHIEGVLQANGWQYANWDSDSTPLIKFDLNKSDTAHYAKRTSRTLCHVFFYNGLYPDPPGLLAVAQSCHYYYRSVLDL